MTQGITQDECALLSSVCRNNHRSCSHGMISTGASQSMLALQGQTALMKASHLGRLELIDRLLECGADVNAFQPFEASSLTVVKDLYHSMVGTGLELF